MYLCCPVQALIPGFRVHVCRGRSCFFLFFALWQRETTVLILLLLCKLKLLYFHCKEKCGTVWMMVSRLGLKGVINMMYISHILSEDYCSFIANYVQYTYSYTLVWTQAQGLQPDWQARTIRHQYIDFIATLNCAVSLIWCSFVFQHFRPPEVALGKIYTADQFGSTDGRNKTRGHNFSWYISALHRMKLI